MIGYLPMKDALLPNTIITIDGNDGTGKSTLVEKLWHLGYNVADRGYPTEMTDKTDVQLPQDGLASYLYIILDCPVEVSRFRLARAGKNLDERYHTVEDLSYYRDRYKDVADRLLRLLGREKVLVVDSEQPMSVMLDQVLTWLRAK